MVIAIDGPAGSGKSSTAKLVAQRLRILHLDTGAMYRAVTLKCLRQKIAYTDIDALQECVRNTQITFSGTPPEVKVFMDGEDVTDSIRSEEVTNSVSDYCTPEVVRTELVEQQRQIGRRCPVVCEGRDVGTVVFPDAALKFYMVASVEERARRRQKDFEKLNITKNIHELIREISQRDEKDSSRQISPLCKAVDAELIDTTQMSLHDQVDYIVKKARAHGF